MGPLHPLLCRADQLKVLNPDEMGKAVSTVLNVGEAIDARYNELKGILFPVDELLCNVDG
jgi:hypothetical protein